MKSFIAFLILLSFSLSEFKNIYQDIFGNEIACGAIDLENEDTENQDDEKQENKIKKIDSDKCLYHQDFAFFVLQQSALKNRTTLSFLYASAIVSINIPPPKL